MCALPWAQSKLFLICSKMLEEKERRQRGKGRAYLKQEVEKLRGKKLARFLTH